MCPPVDIEAELRTEELRARFLAHTRAAFRLLPPLERPVVLDVGCGDGLPTLELARLGGGVVVGLDPDRAALRKLRQRIARAGLERRVRAVAGTLDEVGLAAASFDVVWAEGVLHLLDPARSFPACRRLLKPRGFLVLHETVSWFDSVTDQLRASGFELFARHLLPPRCWWTDYGAPLRERIHALRQARGAAVECEALARHERDVATLESDPEQRDCGFFLLRKRPA